MMHGLNGMNLGMGWIWIIGLIIFISIIWVIVKTISQNNNSKQTREKSPLEILKERYAKGEINKDEFDERKHELK